MVYSVGIIYIYFGILLWYYMVCRKKQDARQNTKLIITHSLFKLDVRKFAWKFILALYKKNQKNSPQNKKLVIYHSVFKPSKKISDFFCPKTRWPPKHKIDHKSFSFQARSTNFCMEVHIDPKQNGPKTRLPLKIQN